MSDLTDRMRTCAAFLLWAQEHGDLEHTQNAVADATNLLIEAANALEVAPVAIETIEKLIEQPKQLALDAWEADVQESVAKQLAEKIAGTWIAVGDALPTARLKSSKVCPKCDSRANKITRIQGNRVMLTCPVCATAWEFKQ